MYQLPDKYEHIEEKFLIVSQSRREDLGPTGHGSDSCGIGSTSIFWDNCITL